MGPSVMGVVLRNSAGSCLSPLSERKQENSRPHPEGPESLLAEIRDHAAQHGQEGAAVIRTSRRTTSWEGGEWVVCIQVSRYLSPFRNTCFPYCSLWAVHHVAAVAGQPCGKPLGESFMGKPQICGVVLDPSTRRKQPCLNSYRKK